MQQEYRSGSAAANLPADSRKTSEIPRSTPKGGGRSLLQRLGSRLFGGFVLAIHEIPAARIAEFVDALWPARPIPFAELVHRAKNKKTNSGLFAITVDDGVADNVRALAKLFRTRGWPATFYLPTAYLDSGIPMPFQSWWRLKPLLRGKIMLRSGMTLVAASRAFHSWSKNIELMWYRERLEAYLPLMQELLEIVSHNTGIRLSDLRGPAPIPWKEVAELSRSPLIRFESHGVSHSALSALTEKEITYEMLHSQQRIADHTGNECRHFCYPFGSQESIGLLAPRIARKFYDSASTMSMGSIDAADPWLLPRIPLYPKNSLTAARLKVLLRSGLWAGSPARRQEA